jgi:hypothetical protein
MAVEVSRTSIFTVKYLDPDGGVNLIDMQAAGMTEAKDKFAAEYPGCSVVNIWRKQ